MEQTNDCELILGAEIECGLLEHPMPHFWLIDTHFYSLPQLNTRYHSIRLCGWWIIPNITKNKKLHYMIKFTDPWRIACIKLNENDK